MTAQIIINHTFFIAALTPGDINDFFEDILQRADDLKSICSSSGISIPTIVVRLYSVCVKLLNYYFMIERQNKVQGAAEGFIRSYDCAKDQLFS